MAMRASNYARVKDEVAQHFGSEVSIEVVEEIARPAELLVVLKMPAVFTGLCGVTKGLGNGLAPVRGPGLSPRGVCWMASLLAA